MRVTSIDAAPAEVIGKPWRMRAPGQAPEPLQVLAIRPVRGAEVHRDAMLDHAILLEDPVQDLEGASAIDHEILRDDLKPIHPRLFLEDVPVMRHAQPDADAVFRVVIEWVGGHDKFE